MAYFCASGCVAHAVRGSLRVMLSHHSVPIVLTPRVCKPASRGAFVCREYFPTSLAESEQAGCAASIRGFDDSTPAVAECYALPLTRGIAKDMVSYADRSVLIETLSFFTYYVACRGL